MRNKLLSASTSVDNIAVKGVKDAADGSWDELEQSTVADIADDTEIVIAGDPVEMVISKKF